MTTSNDDATTQLPESKAATSPAAPAPSVGASQDATREMPTSDPGLSSDPLAIFREAPTTQMPSDPFRTDADASGAAGRQGEAGSPTQAAPNSTPLASTRTAFDPASTGESTPPPRDAGAGLGGQGPAGGNGEPTWSAQRGPIDMRTLPEAPSGGVRVGTFVWACLVCMVGLFLIAEAFIPSFNLPLLGIGAIAALGIVLILTALFSGHAKKRANGTAGGTNANREG